MSRAAPAFGPAAWRQIGLITAAAAGLFVAFRSLPTGTNLSHMDFRVSGGNSIEFCDPANPQFLPVVDVRSPVTLELRTAAPPVAGAEVNAVLTLKTASGKPIAPEDLLEVHTKKLHLMIIDPSLTDYQHVHPQATRTPGEWAFHFDPRYGGNYRIFADFTPVATNRGLYANTELLVAGAPPTPAAMARARQASWVTDQAGYRFALVPATLPIRVRQPADLKLIITSPGGGRVPLEPVMGAFAHLVAFDGARSGFAHLHPVEINLLQPPDAVRPALNFKVMIPSAGRYVIWAQVNLAGSETFAPFWFDVAP